MRSILLLGLVVAGAAGCDMTRHGTVHCVPCHSSKKMSCQATPAAAAPSAPAVLPPTIKEVRAEEPEQRHNANAQPGSNTAPAPSAVPSAPAPAPVANQDVLLVPRWVYVPYSPHVPTGPTKLPANMQGMTATGPYVQSENVTVLPPMGMPPVNTATPTVQMPTPTVTPTAGSFANPNQTQLMEQCVQQMKMLNKRINELESKNATHPSAAVTIPALPLPPVTIVPVTVLPPVKAQPMKDPPQVGTPLLLPLPPPIPAAPMIPPAK